MANDARLADQFHAIRTVEEQIASSNQMPVAVTFTEVHVLQIGQVDPAPARDVVHAQHRKLARGSCLLTGSVVSG